MSKINKYQDKGGKKKNRTKESPRRREKRKQMSRGVTGGKAVKRGRECASIIMGAMVQLPRRLGGGGVENVWRDDG
jgi:hypothetical protein